MSPLQKQTICTKGVILDEIYIFRDLVMLDYQLIEKNENIAKSPESFRDGFCVFSEWTQLSSRTIPNLPIRMSSSHTSLDYT